MSEPPIGSPSSWNRLKLGGGIFLLTMCLGVCGYVIAGWPALDALYMVVITVFGVGYGEVHAIESPGLRVFTIGLIVSGCSALIYILGGVFQLITEGELNRALGRRRMIGEIEKLADHVIICGFGRIGRVLASALAGDGVPFVVVDRDAARLEEAVARGALVFEGDATSDATLAAVGIARARTLATVLPSDALNVFITLTARNLNARLHIVSRGEDPTVESKLVQAGADRVVLPTAIGADQMAQLILHPHADDLFDAGAQLQVTRALGTLGARFHMVSVPAGLTNPPRIEELEKEGGGGFMVVALRTEAGAVIHAPPHGRILASGDQVLVLSRSDRKPDLEVALGSRRTRELNYRGARLRGS